MTHIWLRAEPRAHETRVGLTPDGAAQMIAAGFKITVEDSDDRCIPTAEYVTAGCATAAAGSWPDAPDVAIIFGLKELPEDGTPLRHRHPLLKLRLLLLLLSLMLQLRVKTKRVMMTKTKTKKPLVVVAMLQRKEKRKRSEVKRKRLPRLPGRK